MVTIEEKLEGSKVGISLGINPLYEGEDLDTGMESYSNERCRCPCPIISAPIYAAGLLMFDPLD